MYIGPRISKLPCRLYRERKGWNRSWHKLTGHNPSWRFSQWPLRMPPPMQKCFVPWILLPKA
ncbi:hypothetical protein LEMLEM_LOCUS6084 [Lemmus lemmus]